MSDLRKIFKNTLYLIIAGQLSKLINFFQVIILVRYLDKINFGKWSVIQSIPVMFIIITDIGLNSIMLRKIARKKNCLEMFFQQVVFLKFFLVVIFLSVVFIFVEMCQYEMEVKYFIRIISIAYIISMFSEVIVAVNRAMENFIFESIINIFKSILFFFFVLIIIFLDLKLIGLVYSLLIVNLFIIVFCFVWYCKKYSLKIKIHNLTTYTKLIKDAFPFALYTFISPIFMQIDIIMLSKFSTYESVGIYNASYKIILFLYFIPLALKRVLFPHLSVFYKNSIEDFKLTFTRACLIITILGLPFSVGFFLLSDKIVFLVFSANYIQSIIPLKILAISIFFYYLRIIFTVALYASNNERIAILIFGIATVINIVMDYILISRFDYSGAAVASLFSEGCIFVGYYLIIRKKLFRVKYFKTGLKLAIASLLMGIALWISNSLTILIQIPIGIIVYSITMYMLKVFSKEEYSSIKNLLRKN